MGDEPSGDNRMASDAGESQYVKCESDASRKGILPDRVLTKPV